MQRKYTVVLVTLLALLFFSIPLANAEVTVSAPENVILSLTGDTTEMAVTWRDVAEVAVGQVRYGRTENSSSSAVARRTLASGYNSFEAVMTGLIPGETYYYTVGSAAAWSEMQSFVAPEGDTNSFSFLYLGDVQYNLSLDEYQDWGQLLANAYENYGDAAFAIMCGDMVNNGQSASQWQAFLAQASPVFSKISMMAVPGNHESNDIKTGKPTLMNKLLSLPQNGLAGFEEEFYSFNYGDCHILCLNSNVYLNEQLEAGTMTPDDFERIKTWIASDLGSSSATWKIVVMHHPAYSVVSDKAGAAVLANWVPLFETAEVDLVLYGHQHVYMRTKPIWEGQIDYKKGITYLMSNSGSKHYPGVQTDYHAVLIENMPTYQIVTINSDTLWLGTFSVDGEVLDSCNLSARARTQQGKTEESEPTESLVVNILNPDGSTTPVHEYSYEELEPLEEIEYYATIDAMPAAVGTRAKGVKIHKLIEDAQKYNSSIKWESGQRLVFYVTDAPVAYQPGYYTYDRLYGEDRYYFPELVETFDQEHPEDISLEGAVRVYPILSSSSYQERWATDDILKSTENPVTMNGKESFRFCMGITEEEAQSPSDNPESSTTNKFARWVYRVDVAPLGSPRLIADKTDNAIGQPIEIIFIDNSAWREKIAQVKVDENVLAPEQYEITAGKITIIPDVFTKAGTYKITVESSGFMNSTVEQKITEENLPAVLESIIITKPAEKLFYSVGETLDITGLEVTGHYDDGSSRIEAISAANISGFNSSETVESQTLTITIGDKIATYTVTICESVTAADDGIITVDPNTPLIITVPEDVANTEIRVTQNLSLPPVKVKSDQVEMTIPNGTTVSGSDTIQLPEVMLASSVNVAGAQKVDLVIQVGSNTDTITFSKPIRLLLKGQGTKSAGFMDNDGTFRPISKPTSLKGLTGEGDVNAVVEIFEKENMQEGAVASGQDLIIWTMHFTRFITYIPLSAVIPIYDLPEIYDEFLEFDQFIRSQVISSRGGIIKIAEAMFIFPTDAVGEDIEVSIKKICKDNITLVSSEFKLLGEVYEITANKKVTFKKPITITLYFDQNKVDKDKYDAGIYCWSNKEWVLMDQVKADMEAGKVSGSVSNFSMFAVLLSEKGKMPIDEEKQPNQDIFQLVKSELKDIANHWAEKFITELVAIGAVNGYLDGTFKPDNSITRAEFATMMVKGFKLEPGNGKVFSDTGGHWAKDSIKTAAAHGIVSGYDETSFGPDDLITREQMAVMISKAAHLSGREGKTFADSNHIAHWAKAAVAAASGKNIISGYPDNSLRPRAHATRAEAVTVIVKVLNLTGGR